MPYDNVPDDNAAHPLQEQDYTFRFDIESRHSDGDPRATVDDLDLFSPENQTSNKRMLDFLDRVVTRVDLQGEQLFTHKTVKETYEENGETKERERVERYPEGVRGKRIPLPCLKRLMEGVGAAMREANDPKN